MEKVYPNQPPAINYSNIFISYRSRADEVCRHSMEAHSLVYLYSGRLSITSNGKTYVLHAGECAFIARNYKLEVTAYPEKGRNCVSVYLLFDRKFLIRYYQWLDKSKLPPASTKRLPNVCKLKPNIHIDSIFNSLRTFVTTDQQPTPHYMELKQVEAVDTLIDADNRFCVSLFDFLGAWKTDILDFMESSYREDLSLSEMAVYTGRSLAAFKRDFGKVSELSPSRWVTRRRLQEAHRLITDEEQTPSEIYSSLGFKSLSHFSTAFKRQYGETPSELLNKARQ